MQQGSEVDADWAIREPDLHDRVAGEVRGLHQKVTLQLVPPQHALPTIDHP